MFKTALSAAICWITIEAFVGYFILPPINFSLVFITAVVGVGAYAIGSNLEGLYNDLEFRKPEGYILHKFGGFCIESSKFNNAYICFRNTAIPINSIAYRVIAPIGEAIVAFGLPLMVLGVFHIVDTMLLGTIGMVAGGILLILSLTIPLLFQ